MRQYSEESVEAAVQQANRSAHEDSTRTIYWSLVAVARAIITAAYIIARAIKEGKTS